MYEDKSKKTVRKTFDLSSGTIKGIYFHYDENAPKQSKRVGVKEKDESRFDIYVSKPFPR